MFSWYDLVKFLVNVLLALVYLDQAAHRGWITPALGVSHWQIFFTVAVVSRVVEFIVDKALEVAGSEEADVSLLMVGLYLIQGWIYVYGCSIMGFYTINQFLLGIIMGLIYNFLRLPMNLSSRHGPPANPTKEPWQPGY